MHSDVDQYETSTTGLTPDSELLTVLSAEAARVAGEEVQPRNPSRIRSSTDATYTSQGRTNTYPKSTRRRRVWAAPPPQRVVLPRAKPSRRNPGSVLRSHAQRLSGLLKNDETRAEVIGKAGRDGGKEPKTRHGKGLYDGKQGRRRESERGRPSPASAVSEKISAVGARCDVCCSRNDEDGGVERREVGGVVGCSLRNVVGAQQMVQPDGWSNRSSATRVRREQISAPPIASGRNDGLKTKEFDGSALLVGHFSVHLLTGLVCDLT